MMHFYAYLYIHMFFLFFIKNELLSNPKMHQGDMFVCIKMISCNLKKMFGILGMVAVMHCRSNFCLLQGGLYDRVTEFRLLILFYFLAHTVLPRPRSWTSGSLGGEGIRREGNKGKRVDLVI